MSVLICVRFVTRHSGLVAVYKHINAYIVVSALILVMCVIRHSV